MWGGIRVSQLLSAALVLGAALFLIIRHRKKRTPAAE
jgi:hypothetical protein